MTKKSLLISTIFSAVLFCDSVTLAQEPVQDINKEVHPNLAEAQFRVVLASDAIVSAQKDNRYDMHGHAERARQLLVQVNQELKLAALDANAANQSDAVVAQGGSATDRSLQNLISSSCNGTQPGVVPLKGDATYSVSSTITIPSNCTIRGNGARINATTSLVGDLISITSVSDVHLIGPLTLNSASANANSKPSRTVVFLNAKHSSVNDISFTGSTHGELSLWGVSDFEARNLTFANASAHGASSPAMVIFNWVGGTPTLASTDVNVDGVQCIGSPTTTPGCILADGNYNHSGTPGQSNQRVNVSNVRIQATTDDGVEFDHTAGTITGIHCGPGIVKNQCVLLRQTSHVKVESITCDGGTTICVDVARFVADDDGVDDINIAHVTGTGMSGSQAAAVVRVMNPSTSKDVTNVTVDGVVADGSLNAGIHCQGPMSTGAFLQHVSFDNVISRNNKGAGMLIQFCQDVTINNLQTLNNNQAKAPCSSLVSGLYITYSQDVVVNGIRAYDDQARKTQCYGLTVDRGSKRVRVGSAELRDDLNAAGGVHNESADVYIVYRKAANATTAIGVPPR